MSDRKDKPLTARENAIFQAVARRLFELVKATDQVLEYLDQPVAGSAQAIAFAHGRRATRHDDAFLRIHALAFAALDGLRTIEMLFRGGSLPSFSLYTVLRGTAEATIRCRHLVDPSISESKRLARGLNERYDNIAEVRLYRRTDAEEEAREQRASGSLSRADRLELNRKVIEHLKSIDRDRDERVAHLAERARSHRIRPKTENNEPNGTVIGFEEAWKSDFDVFGKYIRKGGSYYRLISGLAHLKSWALHLKQDVRRTSESGGVISTELQLEIFCPLLETVLNLHDDNIRDWHLLAGYGADRWGEAKARARA